MNSLHRQYLFGLIFMAIGIYQIITNNYVESSLYIVAGIAFVMNALTLEVKLVRYKRTLVIVTWVFIILSALLFLYVLRSKF